MALARVVSSRLLMTGGCVLTPEAAGDGCWRVLGPAARPREDDSAPGTQGRRRATRPRLTDFP